jgi:hypothetical protein
MSTVTRGEVLTMLAMLESAGLAPRARDDDERAAQVQFWLLGLDGMHPEAAAAGFKYAIAHATSKTYAIRPGDIRDAARDVWFERGFIGRGATVDVDDGHVDPLMPLTTWTRTPTGALVPVDSA